MSESRSVRLEELFHQAVGLPPDERRHFLEEHCGSDAQLRAELEQLLGCDSVVGTRHLDDSSPNVEK